MSYMIQVKNLHKAYGDHRVLKGVNLNIKKSEVIAIIGPSGSGKSSFIRTINGLENFQEGSIEVCGNIRNPGDSAKDVTKKVGMVFQSFNLFPHMTALQNICLALIEVQGFSKKDAEAKAMSLLKKVDLELHAYKLPADLSGGQQQRVAIARALALEPEVMLFDEVTSALDPEITHEVLNVMKDLASSGMTMLVVTHEMDFARKVADQVIFFDEGIIMEQASPEEFFANPQTERAKTFISQVC